MSETLKVDPPSSTIGQPTTTTYLVLTRDDADTALWAVQKEVKARSAEAAIRSYIGSGATSAYSAGTYVAIPARSWKPVTVKAEQTVVLKLESAEAKS